jgi:hypothetical protein
MAHVKMEVPCCWRQAAKPRHNHQKKESRGTVWLALPTLQPPCSKAVIIDKVDKLY